MSRRSPGWLLALIAAGSLLGAADGAGSQDRDAASQIVFIGGVGPRYATLADPAVSAALLRTGRIGLYQHADGNAVLTPGERSALWATWKAKDVPGAETVAEIGGSAVEDPSYLQFFGGRYPAEVNMNTLTNSGDGTGSYRSGSGEAAPGHVYGGYVSAADLAVMERQICIAVRQGARNVAIVMTPNGGSEDLADGFDAAPFWANVRAAALFGGGIGLDVPPTYWVLRGAGYQAQVARMTAWANASGIRSSLIVSPYAEKPDAAGHSGGCGYDPAFAENARRLADDLAAAHALPTQWIVENYGASVPGCGTANDIMADQEVESLNAVALALARSSLVSVRGAVEARGFKECVGR